MDYFIYVVHYLNRKNFWSFHKLYLVMQQACHASRSLFCSSCIYQSLDEQYKNCGVGVSAALVVPDRGPSCQRRAQQHSDGALRLAQWRGDVFIVKDRS